MNRTITAIAILALQAAHAHACENCGMPLAIHAEHEHALQQIVPLAAMTHTAVDSGRWSDLTTWGGDVPHAAAHVCIPDGIVVKYDSQAEIRALLIDGVMVFSGVADPCRPCEATTGPARLAVEHLVVSETGSLEIGRRGAPVEAEIVLADTGPLDQRDWRQMGRGVLVIGKLSIWGREKTSWTHCATPPRAGDVTLTLTAAPAGWAIGDKLIVPGVRPPKRTFTAQETAQALAGVDIDPLFRQQHEVRTITAVDGPTITLDAPLAHDFHYQLPPGVQLPIGNLTRSVTIRSANPAAGRRGHMRLSGT